MGNCDSACRNGFQRIAAAIWLLAATNSGLTNAEAQVSSAGRQIGWKASPHILAEFDVGTDGRLLLVPVRVTDEECQFVVDTGASLTLLDQSLRGKMASAVGSAGLAAAAGIAPALLYTCPELAIGSIAVELPGPVACCDLGPIRRATGLPIQGVLGMDFLRSQIVQIDFDSGKLRFLNESKKLDRYGEPHALECDAGNRPYLCCGLPGVPREWFLLDTGATGKSLRAAVFDRLVDGQQLAVGVQSTAATVSGDVTCATGKLARLRIGSFSHEGIIVARDARVSSLGIDYLNRYLLTLDLPRQTAYLSPAKRHESPDDPRIIGLTLTAEDGEVRVKSVTPGGPAATAGVEAGDIILLAGRRPVCGSDLFEFREALIAGDRPSIELCLNRGGRILNVIVTRQDRFAMKDENALCPASGRANNLKLGSRPSPLPIQLP
jgi:predicted aspartyl protease